MTHEFDEIDALHSALAYEQAKEEIGKFEKILGREVLRFTGDGSMPALVYRDGDVSVSWSGDFYCTVSSPDGPTINMRIAKTHRGRLGVVRRMCRSADIVCQEAVDEYRARVLAQVA